MQSLQVTSPSPATPHNSPTLPSPSPSHTLSLSLSERRRIRMANYSSIPCQSLSSSRNMSCPSEGPYFCEGFQWVPLVYFSISIVSFLCCCLVFITILLFKRLRGYSSRVFLLRLALVILEYSILFLLPLPPLPLPPPSSPSSSSPSSFLRTSLDFLISICHIILFKAGVHDKVCDGFGVVFEFTLIAANLWYAFLAYDLVRAIRNPFG